MWNEEVIDAIRAGFKGTYIANGAYTADEAFTPELDPGSAFIDIPA